MWDMYETKTTTRSIIVTLTRIRRGGAGPTPFPRFTLTNLNPLLHPRKFPRLDISYYYRISTSTTTTSFVERLINFPRGIFLEVTTIELSKSLNRAIGPLIRIHYPYPPAGAC